MIANLYVIYDTVAQESGPILEARNDGVAVRMFNQARKKMDYPKEFKLYCLGTINHDTNNIDPFVPAIEVTEFGVYEKDEVIDA